MRTLLLSIPLLAGCATAGRNGDPRPIIDDRVLGYWVSNEGALWHLRSTAAGKHHRFQGSIEGLSGGIVEVRTDRSELREHVAQVGNSVQFDYDADDRATRGFDVRSTGGCLRFDLLIDGKRHPELVRRGRRGEPQTRLPTELCP